ncbi:MAG: hypothetical protein PHV95_05995 [Eubacteriales bacterium]|nr:hypothetical protein [Eubacteriales bacterium]
MAGTPITKEIRLEADQYNGNNITEVGFLAAYYDTYYHFVTHAFLQDSEGNQIAIQKTDTDVVIIRGTFYVTFNFTGFGDNGIYPLPEQNGVVRWLLGTGSFPATFAFSRYNLQKSTDLSTNKHGTKSTNMDACTRNATTWRIDYPVITWLDTELNNHTVRTIGMSENTVKSYCRRNNISVSINQELFVDTDACANCGLPLQHMRGSKQKRFCSDKCRMA